MKNVNRIINQRVPNVVVVCLILAWRLDSSVG